MCRADLGHNAIRAAVPTSLNDYALISSSAAPTACSAFMALSERTIGGTDIELHFTHSRRKWRPSCRKLVPTYIKEGRHRPR